MTLNLDEKTESEVESSDIVIGEPSIHESEPDSSQSFESESQLDFHGLLKRDIAL